MRVLITPVDMAGQAALLARDLRNEHVDATLCTYNRNPFGYPRDLVLPRVRMADWFDEHWQEFDVFHYYWGQTMKEDLSDLAHLARHGKKALMRHCGNDLRMLSLARKRNPFVRIHYRNNLQEQEVARHLRKLSAIVRDAVVPDYELFEHAVRFYEKVHVVPRAIEVERYSPVFPDPCRSRPLVVHASSLPFFKGTGDIIDTVNELKKKYDFEFRLVSKMPHQQALEIYQMADIAIDQLLIGTHGVFAVEAMALGKPVISYIRPDLRSSFPAGFPIVSATTATLYEKLEWLLCRPEQRRRLGEKGRMYVELVHDHRKIARQMIRIYRQLKAL